MSSLKFIEIDGKRYLWHAVLARRREQRRAHAQSQQPVLFDLKHDCRPPTGRTPADRYREPSLFDTGRQT
jgi:hypothetical protein